MNLGILNETVMLIDTDFLNDRIAFSYQVYTEVYPDKEFGKINLANLLYTFAENSRISEAGKIIDILFAYKLGQSNLSNCEPNDVFNFMDVHNVGMETDIGNFRIRSFFADEHESTQEHLVNMLQMIYLSRNVSRIIIVADNDLLNPNLRYYSHEEKKSILMLRKYRNSEIDYEIPYKYVNINNLIPFAMGLTKGEL